MPACGVMLLISPENRSGQNTESLPETKRAPDPARPRRGVGVVLLALALWSVGCQKTPREITPAECQAICSPRHVYSWAPQLCTCWSPCDEETAEPDGGR